MLSDSIFSPMAIAFSLPPSPQPITSTSATVTESNSTPSRSSGESVSAWPGGSTAPVFTDGDSSSAVAA